MIGLRNPDTRRALRAIVEAVIAVALLSLVWWIAEVLRGDAAGLREIARGTLIIIGLGTVFYGMENVTRAFRFQVGPAGVAVEAGSEQAIP
jgi:TRAP-type C4-dicarboxylate transport system permease small subunit